MTDQEEEQAILAKLGFTSSQAKVYLALAVKGPSTAKTVAKTAQIDRGETYRVMAALEEKGFLQKILDCPLKYQAIPIKDLLPILVENRKKEVALIEKETQQLIRHKASQNGLQLKPEEEYIKHVPQAGKALEEIRKDDESVRVHVEALSSLRTLQEIEEENFLKELKKRVKTEMVLNAWCDVNDIPDHVKKSTQYPNFSLRIPRRPLRAPKTTIEFIILDGKKVWLRTSEASFYKSSWLVTNNLEIIALAQNLFAKIWQDSTPIKSNKSAK